MTYNEDAIPESTLETLQAWIKTGRPMGDFCDAVVSNNLQEAFARADEHNIRAMFHTVCWMYNNAPRGSWGSPKCLKEWPKKLRSLEHANDSK